MEKTMVLAKIAEKPNYESEILRIIRGNTSPKAMLNQLEDYHGSDIADVIEQLSEQERKKVFRICPAEMLAEAFAHLEEEKAGECLKEISPRKAGEIVSEMETDDAVEILHTIGREKRELILGVLSFAMVGLYIMLFKHKTMLFSFAVSGCIGVSLILAMLISSAVGTLIPLFFKKIKVDPAVASGPLITTVNDLVAVVTYYGMSWILLLNVLKLV